ncbi:E3 ubiquitin-protein ligase TRIM56-like isoform X2 [Littorina saxatilis]|uniref:Uncharacterized protein n=2 Tax=Littorina saxatilis TaxID=31220 RepID=A0AAN9AK62_9CAEN
MATAAGTSSADSDTECSVCHELFKNPKLLPCAHVLCRHCLLSWLASNPEALCPLCRGAIADPKEKSKTKGWEEVVDALPDDVAMAALVESTRVLNMDHVCVACQSVAVSLCLNCSDMVCKACSQVHIKFSANHHHKVEDLSSMTAEELAASQPDHCSVHTSKPCELFCPTHGTAICHLCAIAKHRACPDLTELVEAADKSREELSQMVKSLLTEEQQLEEAVAALERHLEATGKVVQEAVAEIDRTCNKLENSVKECRRRLMKMTLDAKAKVKDTVLAVKVTLLDHRGRLTSHRRVADRTNRGSTNKGMCDVTCALRDRVKDILDTSRQRRVNWESVSIVTVILDTATVSRIEKELSELGQVKISPFQDASNIASWLCVLTQGVRNVASLSLAINYPNAASAPHSVINGFNNLLAIALETNIDVAEAAQTKGYPKKTSTFADVTASDIPKQIAVAKKEESEESGGIGLFD